MQGERRTIAYFAWPHREAIIEGPQGKYPAISAADLLAAEGDAYASRKDDDTWKQVSDPAQTCCFSLEQVACLLLQVSVCVRHAGI